MQHENTRRELPDFQWLLVVPLDCLMLELVVNEHLYCCPYSKMYENERFM